MIKKSLVALSLFLGVAGCSVQHSNALVTSDNTITVQPSTPRIGDKFTIAVGGRLNATINQLEPPDGDYRVKIEVVEVLNQPGHSPTFAPAENVVRVDLGGLAIRDGKGEASFLLKGDYGDVKPVAGKGLFVYLEGEKWGQGINVVVR